MFKLPTDTTDFVIIKEIMAVKVSYFKPKKYRRHIPHEVELKIQFNNCKFDLLPYFCWYGYGI